MLESDKASFAKLMGAMGEVYNKQVSPGLISLYFECLKDLDLASVKENIIKLLNKKQFNIFPTPAEIRNPYNTKEIEAEIETEAQMKWLEVISTDYPHDFGGTTNAVINRALGGFDKFQNRYSNLNELEIKKNFITYYKIFKKQGITESFVKGLPAPPTESEKEKEERDKRRKELIKEAEQGLPKLTEKEVRENIKKLAQLLKKLEKEER